MNCSIINTEISFEKFVEKVGEHFKHIPEEERMRQLKEIYERETGRSVKDRKLQSMAKTPKKNKEKEID